MHETTASFAAPCSLSTSTPDGLDMVQWRGRDGSLHEARAGRGVLHERLWEGKPIRTGVQYPNRGNQHGLYFWPRTGEHVWYESALELACLVELDYAGQVLQVAAQPFRLLFRRAAAAGYHDPDFFALHAGGDQVVYDVKPAKRIDVKARRRFDETDRVCALAGWRHEVLSELSTTRAANLAFLRPARLPRCHPPDGVFGRLLQVFGGGRPIGEGAAAMGGRHPALVMPHIKHLIWHRQLVVDLDEQLDFHTMAAATGRTGSCCG